MQLEETVIDLPPEEGSDEFLRVRKCDFGSGSNIETEYWLQWVRKIEGDLITVTSSFRISEDTLLMLMDRISKS